MNRVRFPTIFRRFMQTVKPHTPLIRFRKGAVESTRTTSVQEQYSCAKSGATRNVIEDFQLPLKYRRRPLDEAEINAINSGGIC